MNSILHFLVSSPEAALFLGLAVSLCFLTAGLSFAFYRRLKQSSLLYFGIVLIAGYLSIGLSSFHPEKFFTEETDIRLFSFIQMNAAVGIYFYSRLILSSFHPYPLERWLPIGFFKALTMTVVLSRFTLMLLPEPRLIKISELLLGIFFLFTIWICLAFRSATRSAKLVKMGCTFFSLMIATFPLMISGVIPAVRIAHYQPFLMIGSTAVFSGLWLFALVESAREILETSALNSARTVAQVVIRLRDLIHSPLQNIANSVAHLKYLGEEAKPTLDMMESALRQISKINAQLSQYETVIDWKRPENFENLRQHLGKSSVTKRRTDL